MSADVRALLATAGAADFEYRDIAEHERAGAALRRWPLLDATYNTLLEARLIRPPVPRGPALAEATPGPTLATEES